MNKLDYSDIQDFHNLLWDWEIPLCQEENKTNPICQDCCIEGSPLFPWEKDYYKKLIKDALIPKDIEIIEVKPWNFKITNCNSTEKKCRLWEHKTLFCKMYPYSSYRTDDEKWFIFIPKNLSDCPAWIPNKEFEKKVELIFNTLYDKGVLNEEDAIEELDYLLEMYL